MFKRNEEAKYPRNGVLLLKMAVLYLLLGLLLGLYMAASGQFQLRAVHTHINLLGWVTLGMTGMIYCQFPQLAQTRLANWHLWLHNLGLPVMMLALGFYHLGYQGFEPLLGMGSVVTLAGLLAFGINLFRRIDAMPQATQQLSGAALLE